MPVRIKKGDVIFTADASGSVNHIMISTAQRLGSAFGSGRASSVHAAIATGRGRYVVESVGSGLKHQKLKPGRYRSYSYVGAHSQEIRERAVELALAYEENEDYGRYNFARAARSPFMPHKPTRGVGNRHNSVFCSSFVWLCLTEAAEEILGRPIIRGGHSQIGPRDLEGKIRNDRAGWFRRYGHAIDFGGSGDWYH